MVIGFIGQSEEDATAPWPYCHIRPIFCHGYQLLQRFRGLAFDEHDFLCQVSSVAGQRVHVTVLVDASTFMLLQATFGPLLQPHFGCKAAKGQLNDHHCAFEGIG
jgi:hypothetical protein